MSLLKNVKVTMFNVGIMLFLSACSSATFPEISDEYLAENNELKEGSSLIGDEKNISYDENQGEKITPVKTNPVQVADITEKTKSKGPQDEDLDLFGIPFDEEAEISNKNTKSTPKNVTTASKAKIVASAEQITSKPTAAETDQPRVPNVTYLVDTFYFDNGGASLSGNAYARLRKIAREAKKNHGFVRVMGYASSRTRNTDMASHKMANFKISLARAEAVARVLRQVGMPQNKILVEAMSDNRPAYLEVMPEGERLNRRAEVYISY